MLWVGYGSATRLRNSIVLDTQDVARATSQTVSTIRRAVKGFTISRTETSRWEANDKKLILVATAQVTRQIITRSMVRIHRLPPYGKLAQLVEQVNREVEPKRHLPPLNLGAYYQRIHGKHTLLKRELGESSVVGSNPTAPTSTGAW